MTEQVQVPQNREQNKRRVDDVRGPGHRVNPPMEETEEGLRVQVHEEAYRWMKRVWVNKGDRNQRGCRVHKTAIKEKGVEFTKQP